MVAAAAAAAHLAAAAAQQQVRAGSDSPSGSLSYSAPFSFAPPAAPTPLPQAASTGTLPHFGGRLMIPGGLQQHPLAPGQPQQQSPALLGGLPQTLPMAGLGPIGGSLGPPPRGPGAPCSLYIKNLPSDANELFLYHRFAPLGEHRTPASSCNASVHRPLCSTVPHCLLVRKSDMLGHYASGSFRADVLSPGQAVHCLFTPLLPGLNLSLKATSS